MLTKNMGGMDRLIRAILGVGALAWLATGQGPLHWLGLIGLVPLATAAIGVCPLYSLFGWSTRPVKP